MNGLFSLAPQARSQLTLHACLHFAALNSCHCVRVANSLVVCAFLAGELLYLAEPFLEKNMHPTVIIRGYKKALDDALAIVDKIAFPIDFSNSQDVLKVVQSCLQTKFTSRFGSMMAVSEIFH